MVSELTRQEIAAGGVLDMDTSIVSTITSHGPGYLDKDKELIVGFQTDKPSSVHSTPTAASVPLKRLAKTTATR